MLTWVIYDIVDDGIRDKISDKCKDYGLYRVQKSVFLGDINISDRDALALECGDLIDVSIDSVYIFPMDEESFKKIKLIGCAFDKDLVEDELLTYFC